MTRGIQFVTLVHLCAISIEQSVDQIPTNPNACIAPAVLSAAAGAVAVNNPRMNASRAALIPNFSFGDGFSMGVWRFCARRARFCPTHPSRPPRDADEAKETKAAPRRDARSS